jgi:signal transduction histidine kinase
MNFSLSLQTRLALTSALFTGAALGLLAVIINFAAGLVFTGLVKENIAEKSGEIVRMIGGRYRPLEGGFDIPAIEALGMYFVHEGYLISLRGQGGGTLWDARNCDMEECSAVVEAIAGRMEGRFRFKGALVRREYPVTQGGLNLGTVAIETYGPFFFSEAEARFLGALNRVLLGAALLLSLLSAAGSLLLSRSIARPVRNAARAARELAKARSGAARGGGPAIRVEERFRTRELAGLARSVNELAGELEEAERRERQLSADIAHELRTPLACLQGTVEAMIDGVFEPTRERLESCHGEILRLAGLAGDLHTLAGLEWETIALRKTGFDLGKLLETTAEQFSAEAREKGLSLRVELPGPAPVLADYDRLKQVFINLLSNALKYTPRGSVVLSLQGGEFPPPDSEAPGPPRFWEAAVTDTGIGIAAEDLPHVFERFYRSDKSRSRNSGGAGIGLAIAAAILRAHGGTIGAEALPGGTIFRVRLPA